MKLATKLEDTLGGGWPGLYGEVVTEDCYRLQQLDFVPDIVFDIGANVGTFTRFARSLWPRAVIVAVEPDKENCAHFRKFTPMPNVFLIEAAIGVCDIWRCTTARNGAGEVYMSPGPGYPLKKIMASEVWKPAFEIDHTSLCTVIESFISRGDRAVLKVDCEGSENQIFGHSESMAAMQKMEYIAMELHRYAFDHSEQAKVDALQSSALIELARTHNLEVEGVHLWARKKL